MEQYGLAYRLLPSQQSPRQVQDGASRRTVSAVFYGATLAKEVDMDDVAGWEVYVVMVPDIVTTVVCPVLDSVIILACQSRSRHC